jgi:hypothetical protein
LIEPWEGSILCVSAAMARGWESKSVESQIESAGSDRTAPAAKRRDPETAEAIRKKQTLLLARAHLLAQMEACQNPRHLAMIENALADLEKSLAQFS